MEYTNEKQRLLVEYLVSSPDTFAMCKAIAKTEYFDPALRKTVDFIHEYFDKYNTTPDVDQVLAETKVKLTKRDLKHDQIEYCSNQIEAFCKQMALQRAIYAAPEMIQEGKYNEVERAIRDAIAVSLNKDLGTDYFADPLSRIEKESLAPLRTTTGWTLMDEILGGGLARTEMMLFTANSGGGKSITLANLGLNMVTQNLNVLYLSLELSESLIARRFDTIITGVPSVMWHDKHQEIAADLQGLSGAVGKLVIKYMPTGTNANTIRGYLKEFQLKHDYIPDMLIVDYLDLMGANEKVSADNISEKDKRAAEQLRDIGNYYNMFIATASQQNRQALEADQLHQGHIAGGLTKINTVDVCASIILDSAMKAKGVIGFEFLKTRNSDGVGKRIYLDWDNTKLRIMNPRKDMKVDEDGVIIDRISATKHQPKLTIHNLLEI